MDATTVYGTSKEIEEHLRDFTTGGCFLRTSGPNSDFLPLTTEPTLNDDGINVTHMVAGDNRVQEQALLTAMHTVCLHYLAVALSDSCPMQFPG